KILFFGDFRPHMGHSRGIGVTEPGCWIHGLNGAASSLIRPRFFALLPALNMVTSAPVELAVESVS
ncbi:MAG: hypothetical protein V3S29_00730, partial [bacterium]